MTGPVLWDEDQITHLYAVFSRDLQLCGCGAPRDAYALVFRILDWAADSTAEGAARPAELTDEAVAHLILSMLDDAGLTDHGMTMTYPWLTPKGRAVRALLSQVSDWLAFERALDDTGYPHYPELCTNECWSRWDPGQ